MELSISVRLLDVYQARRSHTTVKTKIPAKMVYDKGRFEAAAMPTSEPAVFTAPGIAIQ